ncbi:MAG: HIT domain-containing protein [Chloroflexi bacterium]|nr:HIT domain-containing protein [Chloroflexota bacterium]
MTDVLWTPWRLGYIVGEKPAGCILCQKHQEPAEKDRHNYLLHRAQCCFIMLNLYPYNNGHLMIAPYEHVGELEMLNAETLTEMMRLTQRAVAALKKAYSPVGFNLGINIGHVAGAGVADHLHIHVVPRWAGDTNFMSVLADTRLIPEALDATYDKLRAIIKEEGWT